MNIGAFMYIFIYVFFLKKKLEIQFAYNYIGRSITLLSILYIKGSWKARYRKNCQTNKYDQYKTSTIGSFIIFLPKSKVSVTYISIREYID